MASPHNAVAHNFGFIPSLESLPPGVIVAVNPEVHEGGVSLERLVGVCIGRAKLGQTRTTLRIWGLRRIGGSRALVGTLLGTAAVQPADQSPEPSIEILDNQSCLPMLPPFAAAVLEPR